MLILKSLLQVLDAYICKNIQSILLSITDRSKGGTSVVVPQCYMLFLLVGWLVVLGLTTLSDSISVYIGPSPKEREKEQRKARGE